MDRFDTAHSTRQKMLDFINKSPACSHVQISLRFEGMKPGDALKHLKKMEANWEIRIDRYSNLVLCTALRERTTTAEEMRRAAKAKQWANRVKNLKDQEPEPTGCQKSMSQPVTGKPWLVRNVGDRKPIRNPDAMGRVVTGLQSGFSIV